MPTAKTTKKKSKTTKKSLKTTAKTKARKKPTTKKKIKKFDKILAQEATIDTSGIEPGLLIDEPIEEITANISGLTTDGLTGSSANIPLTQATVDFDISRKVLARIASMAACEIKGFIPPRQDPLVRFIDAISGRTDGIRVDVGTTEAAVDMQIRVKYGSRIPDLTHQLREKVASRIYEMTGLNVVEINVRIQDVTETDLTQPTT